ncbi:hypothetical protein R1flu_010851 [Riccia fluitans]|uniref:Uncharacterized protein n=1 Tax=Riccia fluitans TaxID=41844 RepID=A0ABD1Z8M3_9MARC
MSLEPGSGEPNEWQAKPRPCVYPRLVATTLRPRTGRTLEYYEGIGHSDLVTHGRNSPLFDGSADALIDELRDEDYLQVDLSERKGWMQLTRMLARDGLTELSADARCRMATAQDWCGRDFTVGDLMPLSQGWFALNTAQIASVFISGMEAG